MLQGRRLVAVLQLGRWRESCVLSKFSSQIRVIAKENRKKQDTTVPMTKKKPIIKNFRKWIVRISAIIAK